MADVAARCVSMLAVLGVVGLLFEIGSAAKEPSLHQHNRRMRMRDAHGSRAYIDSSAGGNMAVVAPKLAAGISVTYDPEESYKSQDGQDKWANEHVFRGMTRGKFVDLGCYDGITYSNTWYFENVLNWTGLCVEPNPEVFPRIASQAGRASGVQLAVSDTPGTLPFVAAYMRSSLNASAVDYAFLQSQGVVASSVEVHVTTPSLLLAGHRATRDVAVIDYVSVDVEQLELAILRAWPFDRYCVRLFNVENEPPDGAPSTLPQLKALLEPLGYEHVLRIGVDEVFRRTSPCAIAIDSPSGRHSGAMGGRGAPRATRKLRGVSRHRRKE